MNRTLVLILVVLISLIIVDWNYGLVCKVKSMSSSDEYCAQVYFRESNVTGGSFYWDVKSHAEDEIQRQKFLEARRIEREEEALARECYNDGQDYSFSYDLIKDYGLTCSKISYINDHLIDEKIDGGYISGSYSGFLSRGSIEGRSQIIQDALAVGNVLQNISYHLDCKDQEHDREVDYYDESEFVLYYVERCIG